MTAGVGGSSCQAESSLQADREAESMMHILDGLFGDGMQHGGCLSRVDGVVNRMSKPSQLEVCLCEVRWIGHGSAS